MRFGEPVAERSCHMGMTHEQGEDLGHGVFVSPGLGAELTVTSRRLAWVAGGPWTGARDRSVVEGGLV